jgi:hypothetical protein
MKVRSPGKAGAASRDDVSEKDAWRGQSVPSANVQNRELPYSREKKIFEIFFGIDSVQIRECILIDLMSS